DPNQRGAREGNPLERKPLYDRAATECQGQGSRGATDDFGTDAARGSMLERRAETRPELERPGAPPAADPELRAETFDFDVDVREIARAQRRSSGKPPQGNDAPRIEAEPEAATVGQRRIRNRAQIEQGHGNREQRVPASSFAKVR